MTCDQKKRNNNVWSKRWNDGDDIHVFLTNYVVIEWRKALVNSAQLTSLEFNLINFVTSLIHVSFQDVNHFSNGQCVAT